MTFFRGVPARWGNEISKDNNKRDNRERKQECRFGRSEFEHRQATRDREQGGKRK